MEEPKVLGTNLFACAAATGGAFVAAAAAFKVGGMVAVAAVCNAPVVGVVLAGGFIA